MDHPRRSRLLTAVAGRRTAWALAGAGLFLVGVAVGARGEDSGRHGGGEHLAEGQALHAAHCASCHGASLEGQPDWQAPGPDGI